LTNELAKRLNDITTLPWYSDAVLIFEQMSSTDETFSFSFKTTVYHQLTLDSIEKLQ
jgi:hypothetical protein